MRLIPLGSMLTGSGLQTFHAPYDVIKSLKGSEVQNRAMQHVASFPWSKIAKGRQGEEERRDRMAVNNPSQ